MDALLERAARLLALLVAFTVLGYAGLQARTAAAALDGAYAVAADECPPDTIGTCTDDKDCERQCDEIGGAESDCVDGCCWCFF